MVLGCRAKSIEFLSHIKDWNGTSFCIMRVRNIRCSSASSRVIVFISVCSTWHISNQVISIIRNFLP